MKRLPQDVAYLIVGQVRGDKLTLSTLSLVSKAFSAFSRPLLFRRLTVVSTEPGGFGRFYGFLRDTPRLAEYVYHLAIHGYGLNAYMLTSNTIPIAKLLDVLGLMGSLKTLHIREVFLDFRSLSIGVYSHQQISSLRKLKLKKIADTYEQDLSNRLFALPNTRRLDFMLTLDHLFSLLTFFPSLRHLEVSRISFRSLPGPLDGQFASVNRSYLDVATGSNPGLRPGISTLSTIDSLCLSHLDKPSAIIIQRLRGLKSFFLRPDFRMGMDVVRAPSLSTCRTLSSFTAIITTSLSISNAKHLAWKAISTPIPFLPRSLTCFRIQIDSPPLLQDCIPDFISLFDQISNDEWHTKVQSGLLALKNLRSVKLVMDYDEFGDSRDTTALKDFREYYSRLKDVLEDKLPVLKERGLLVWRGNVFGKPKKW